MLLPVLEEAHWGGEFLQVTQLQDLSNEGPGAAVATKRMQGMEIESPAVGSQQGLDERDKLFRARTPPSKLSERETGLSAWDSTRTNERCFPNNPGL